MIRCTPEAPPSPPAVIATVTEVLVYQAPTHASALQVAELVGAGILDHSGRFVLGSSPRLRKIGEENVFYLHDDVFLSQRDVRELQFAKAAIATGWTLLCRDLGIEPEEISQVLLGGSFGSYLSAASAVKIGLVPKLPLPPT